MGPLTQSSHVRTCYAHKPHGLKFRQDAPIYALWVDPTMPLLGMKGDPT